MRNARVVLDVEEQTHDEKVLVCKKKRRKGYRRMNGHRRKVTVFRVADILEGSGDDDAREDL